MSNGSSSNSLPLKGETVMLDDIDSLLTVRKDVLDVLDETRGVKNLTLLPKTGDVLDER